MSGKVKSDVKVSIIVPVYNSEKFIEECIDSVLKQSLKGIEIIIVDDGSTDKSCQIIEAYIKRDKRINLLKQKHKGSGPARNLGMKNAAGEYIAFLDSDDFYYDDKALEYMYSHGKRNGAAICGSYRVTLLSRGYVDSNYLNLSKYPNEPMWVDFYDVQNDWYYQNYIFKREVIQSNNIEFPPYLRGQDPPFLMNMMKLKRKFLLCPVKLYCYRWGHQKQNFSEVQTVDMIKSLYDVLKIAIECNYFDLVNEIIRRINAGSDYYRFFKKYPTSNVYEWLSRIDSILVDCNLCGKVKILDEEEFRKHNMVKISVIIPVFNVEKYLPECLDSICEQDFDGFEVVCVNDGSKDNSGEILRSYEHKYDNIRVYEKENGGLSSARNYGFKRAKGEYIVYVDSDDVLCSKQALSMMWREVADNDLDVLYYDMDLIFSSQMQESEKRKLKNYFFKKKEYGLFELGCNLFAAFVENWDYIATACGTCVKKKVIQDNNLTFPEGRLNEDESYSFKLILKAGRAKHVRQKWYGYRQRAGSIMNSKVSYKRIVDNVYTLLEKEDVYNSNEWEDCVASAIRRNIDSHKKTLNLLYGKVDKNPEEYRKLSVEMRYILESYLNGNKSKDNSCDFYLSNGEPAYYFPYHLFCRNTRIMIYGSCAVGKQFYRSVKETNYVKLVALVDNVVVRTVVDGVEIIPKDNIKRLEYDAVLISDLDKGTAMAVKEDLVNMGVLDEKIYWIGELYRRNDFLKNFYFKLLEKIR